MVASKLMQTGGIRVMPPPYLLSSVAMQGLEELNKQILLFQQHYLVVKVESLLLDTATKLKGIAKQGYTVSTMLKED